MLQKWLGFLRVRVMLLPDDAAFPAKVCDDVVFFIELFHKCGDFRIRWRVTLEDVGERLALATVVLARESWLAVGERERRRAVDVIRVKRAGRQLEDLRA
jgi:hypothetical protein